MRLREICRHGPRCCDSVDKVLERTLDHNYYNKYSLLQSKNYPSDMLVNHAEDEINLDADTDKPERQANFRNSLMTVARNIERLLLQNAGRTARPSHGLSAATASGPLLRTTLAKNDRKM